MLNKFYYLTSVTGDGEEDYLDVRGDVVIVPVTYATQHTAEYWAKEHMMEHDDYYAVNIYEVVSGYPARCVGNVLRKDVS